MIESRMMLEKKKLDQTKERIEKKQRLISAKERKIRLKKMIDLGALVLKADLADLNLDILFGALLDVRELSRNSSSLEKWEALRKKWSSQNQLQRLIVSIKVNESEELKTILKNRKFRWNSFRREWNGFGKKEELEELLGKGNAEITLVTQ